MVRFVSHKHTARYKKTYSRKAANKAGGIMKALNDGGALPRGVMKYTPQMETATKEK
jgi:hypothetical protein